MAVTIGSSKYGKPKIDTSRYNAIFGGKIWAPPVLSRTITFTIKNAFSGANLANATVKAGSVTGTTNANGVCSLTLPDGVYSIQTSLTGYLTDSYSLTVNASTGTQSRTLTNTDGTFKNGLEVWCSGTRSTKTASQWNDISGKGNHIGWVNATVSGYEYVCNGTSTLGTIPKTPAFLGGQYGSNITILFKADPAFVNHRGVMGPHYAVTTPSGLTFAQHDSGVAFGFYPSNTGGNANSVLILAYNTTNFPNGLTAFHEISMNYDLNQIAVYVNGVLKGSKVIGAHTFNSTNNMTLGRAYPASDTNPRTLQGSIRDFKLYSQTIPQSAIQQNYNHNKAEGQVA